MARARVWIGQIGVTYPGLMKSIQNDEIASQYLLKTNVKVPGKMGMLDIKVKRTQEFHPSG